MERCWGCAGAVLFIHYSYPVKPGPSIAIVPTYPQNYGSPIECRGVSNARPSAKEVIERAGLCKVCQDVLGGWTLIIVGLSDRK